MRLTNEKILQPFVGYIKFSDLADLFLDFEVAQLEYLNRLTYLGLPEYLVLI